MKQTKPKQNQTYTGTLMWLDGVPDLQGESFKKDCQVDIVRSRHKEIPLNLPVYLDFNHDNPKCFMGWGRAWRRGNQIRYKIQLHSGLPEPYIDVMASSLIPVIGGRILARKGKAVTHITIEEIGLTLRASDTRLQPLKGVTK